MSYQERPVNVEQKERLRQEIAGQVDEFIRKGGRVEVIDRRLSGEEYGRASVWRLNPELAVTQDGAV